MKSISDIAKTLVVGSDKSGGWSDLQPQIEPEPEGDGIPDCDLCGNLRKVRLDVPIDHPYFGRLLDCPKCKPYLDEQRARRNWELMQPRIRRYGIIPHPGATFDSLVLEGRPLDLKRARDAALRFAYQEPSPGWLVLYGPVGTGKTHLAMAVANACQQQHKPAFLTDVPGLLDMLRSGYRNDDYEELLGLALNVPYLLLDDLGTEKGSDWAAEKLFQIVNHRYNAQKPLMVTMNESPETLPGRIRSRLQDRHCLVLQVPGSDYRRQR